MGKTLTLETLAIGVAHAVYRNTAVEDYHNEKRLMDASFYENVYRIVSEKVDLLKESIDLLICSHKSGMAEVSKLKNIPPQNMDFYIDVLFGVGCGLKWDAPRETDLQLGNDIAGFLLGGEFKKYCDGTHVFDDTVMKQINQDIVDRAYCVLRHMIKD